jgi:uncharacterized protein with GYD domain
MHDRDSDDQRAQPFIAKLAAGDVEDAERVALRAYSRSAMIAFFLTLPAWRRLRMPLYLGRFSYTTDAMKALLDQPQDRSAAAREVAESLGGKLLGFWFAFGAFDGVFLMEAPDNASAAALAMAVGAGGALSEVETTVLLDMDEAQDAMRKAAAATYRPPGS